MKKKSLTTTKTEPPKGDYHLRIYDPELNEAVERMRAQFNFDSVPELARYALRHLHSCKHEIQINA